MEKSGSLIKFELIKNLPAPSVVNLCSSSNTMEKFCINHKVYSFIWNRDYPESSDVIKSVREFNVRRNVLSRIRKEVVFYLTIEGDYVGKCLYSNPHKNSIKITFPTNLNDRKYINPRVGQLTFNDITNRKKIGIVGSYVVRNNIIRNFKYTLDLNGYLTMPKRVLGDTVSFSKIINFCHSTPVTKDNIKLSECNNEIDYITQDDWSEYERQDVIMVKLGNNDRWHCYDRDMLSVWMDQPNTTMANWVPRDPTLDMDNEGYGGLPGSRRFVMLPDGWWVEKDVLRESINSNAQTLTLVRIGTSRIGNLQGIFGVGSLHGQLPEETIWG